MEIAYVFSGNGENYMSLYKRERRSYEQKPHSATYLHEKLSYVDITCSQLNLDHLTGEFIQPSLVISNGLDEFKIPASLFASAVKYDPLGGRYNLIGYTADAIDVVRAFSPEISKLLRLKPQAVVQETISKSHRNSCLDNPTKDFKKLSASGVVINTHYSKTDEKFNLIQNGLIAPLSKRDEINIASTGNVSFISFRISYRAYEGISGEVGVTANDVEQLLASVSLPAEVDDQNAVNSAYSKMTAGTLETLVMLGEGRETLQHLAQTFDRIFNIYKSIKKGKFAKIAPKVWNDIRSNPFRQSAKAIDVVGDAWLEARYAWRPLLIDAENTVKLLQSDHVLAPRQTFRGWDVESTDIPDELFTLNTPLGIISGTKKYDIVSRVSSGLLCEARMKTALPQELGLLNFGTTAWELIPFSFIVDWFVDVSGWTTRLNASAFFKILTGWSTFLQETKVTYVGTALNGSQLENPLIFELVKTTKTRRPGINRSGPSINLELDVPKLVDLLAIARNFI